MVKNVAFPKVDLDDRRFQDLVDEAKRLIPNYLPEWTNHNVADPGVALIELFAWMTELTLYRLNQVPERLYESFLDLVGVSPYPGAQATTSLTFSFSNVPEEPVGIPLGTEVASAGDSPVIFVTSDELTIVQPEVVAVLSVPSGDDEEPDEGRASESLDELLAQTEVLNIFSSDPLSPGDSTYFGFDQSLTGNLLRVTVEAEVEGVGIDPFRPPITWEVWSIDGWLGCEVRSDGTGGLNRDGEIVIAIPDGHVALAVAGTRAFWMRIRLTVPEIEQPTYRSTPSVRTLDFAAIGGTIAAEHSEIAGEEFLGISSGEPGQNFNVQSAPALGRNENEFVEIRFEAENQKWMEVSNFSQSNRDDLHYTWDSRSGLVEFGPRVRQPDGSWRSYGAVPKAGEEIWVSGYRIGGGSNGNVGPDSLTVLRSAVPYVDRVTNLVSASGGVDVETLENAKMRAPLSLVAGDRAVTASDHERLAVEASPKISRALCIASEISGGPTSLILVVDPAVTPDLLTIDDFVLGDDLIEEVANYLSPRRLIGSSIELRTPRYVGISVTALLDSAPGKNSSALRQECLEAVSNFLSPLSGGIYNSGWPFGQALNAGAISNLLAQVSGVERVAEVALFEADLRNGRRIGESKEVIPLENDALFLSFRPQIVVR
jgi:predicted phage baseplate assembly protein